MRTVRQIAPAKVNLALDILRRRPDGYHDLKMVMQSISLHDTVTIHETGTGFHLRTQSGLIPPGKVSMEERAADAFFARLGRPRPGLVVELEKMIPAYAGMGGGSSDVAALLRGLRELYAPELPDQALEEIGFTIGSDVPFCVRGGAALAEGRGEQLTPLPSLPMCSLVVCKPEFDLPTPALFGRVRVEQLQSRPDVTDMSSALERVDLADAARRLGNVFEEVLTPEEAREIGAIREMLLGCGALGAVMTGSGPTVFGIFETSQAAAGAEAALKNRYRQVFLAHPVKKFEKQE